MIALSSLCLSACLLAVPPTPQALQAAMPALKPFHQRGWLVLSDAPADNVRQIQRTLERTSQEFDRFCTLMGRDRRRPAEPLLCLVFEHPADLEAFARTRDNLTIDAATTPGWFSPTNGWIALADPGHHEDLEQAWQQLDIAESRLQEAHRAGHNTAEARTQLLAAEVDLLEHESTRRLALAAHETLHQLVHHTAAFPHQRNWPLWLHEGLATSFETADRRRPFGPDRDFAPRRDAFLKRLDKGTAFSVTQLLAIERDKHLTPSQREAAYVDGCALVSWLTRVQRRRFAALLDAVGRPGDDMDTTALFERFIGPPDKITRQWWADERRRR